MDLNMEHTGFRARAAMRELRHGSNMVAGSFAGARKRSAGDSRSA